LPPAAQWSVRTVPRRPRQLSRSWRAACAGGERRRRRKIARPNCAAELRAELRGRIARRIARRGIARRKLRAHRLGAAEEREGVGIVLLEEGEARGLRRLDRRERLAVALVAHVEGAGERAVEVGQPHQHVVAARPDVQPVRRHPARRRRVGREAHLLVPRLELLLDERAVARVAQRVPQRRARAVGADQRARARHRHLAAAVVDEVQLRGGAAQVDADELVAEVQRDARRLGAADQELVEVVPRDRVVVLAVVLAVPLEDGLGAVEVDDATGDLRAELEQLRLQRRRQHAQRTQPAPRGDQIDRATC